MEIIRSMTLAEHIFRNAPASPALVDLDGTSVLFGDLQGIVQGLGQMLRLDRFSGADRVGLISPRGPNGLLGFVAISAFATCCPLDPRLVDGELLAALEDLSLVALVDGTGEGRIAQMAGRAGIEVLPMAQDLRTLPRAAMRLQGSFGQAMADSPALLLQTSGTTSKPKHVILTHAQILAATRAIGACYGLSPSDLCLNPMPHHHVHGLISGGLSSLVAGAAQYCLPSFAPEVFAEAFAALQPTWFTGSPAFHLGLLDHFRGDPARPRNPRLRFVRSSSAPFPASALTAFEAMFGAPLLENYGMTETASTVCSNPPPPGVRKLGSVGRPIGAEIRIVDAQGIDAPAGCEGEILMRGPSVITCYASGEAGDAHFRDGWLRTGDMGRVDADGYLFIAGRFKELIKRGGHSVYPLEIDSALLAYPDLAEAIAFSIPHPTLGEELVTAVVARPGAVVDADEVRDFLSQRLSSYKVPSEILVVGAIPKNAAGKTPRRQMRDIFAGYFIPVGTPPSTACERRLLDLWREATGCAELGVDDNVFIAGADPLRAQRVLQALAQDHVRLGLRDVLRRPTVRRQAELIEAARPTSIS